MSSSEPFRRITLKDLAEELGVSDRTVSQALNPRVSNVRVSAKKAEAIRQHAQKRNFRLDTSARSFRMGRLFNLGYFEAKEFAFDFPLRGAAEGVHDAASRRGYRVVMIKVPDRTDDGANPIPFIFREAHLDALVVSHLGHLSPECKEAIDTCNLPVVYLNEQKPENAVYVDDASGMETLTQHLLARGCRRPVYLATSSTRPPNKLYEHYSVRERQRGFKAALKNTGIKPEILTLERDVWQEEMGRWLKAQPGVDAILCPGDLGALRLFRVLYKEKIAVPDELWVTGYGDDFSKECPVPLTTMRIPFYEMGVAAADMAIQLLDGQDGTALPSRKFIPTLVERASTGGSWEETCE